MTHEDKELLQDLITKTTAKKLKWEEDFGDDTFVVTVGDRYAVRVWREKSNLVRHVILSRIDGTELFHFMEKPSDPLSEVFHLFEAAKQNALGLDEARQDLKSLIKNL
jgi:hypothetical protein